MIVSYGDIVMAKIFPYNVCLCTKIQTFKQIQEDQVQGQNMLLACE